MNILDFLRVERGITGIQPEVLFYIKGFPIANSTLMIFLVVVLVLLLGVWSRKYLKEIPGMFQSTIEIIYETLYGHIKTLTGSDHHTKQIFSILGAIFIYIGISNYIGLIPGLTSITFDGVSIFRTPTADFNTTFGLAFGAVVVLHVVSIIDWGFLGHLGKFFKFKEIIQGFKKGVSEGIMAIVDFLIGLLDIIGEIAKVVSLSLRLFGNMYAGEVLMIIIMGAFAYILPSIWLAMGLLVGIIQAIVFGSLVTAYYMLSIKTAEE